jgi:hypothetical protein
MAKGTITEQGSPKQVAETVPADLKEQLLEMVNYWHDQYQPGHFELPAESKYKYAARDPKYSRSKAAKYHHQKPLVKSGDSQRQAGQGIRMTTRRRAGDNFIQARGTMSLPKYFYMKPGGIDLPAELTAITSAEEAELASLYEKKAAEAIAKRPHKKKTRRV